MKINTAFKLSALAAALSVSVPAFAATTISGTGVVPVTGNNTGNSITLNAGTTVNGTLAAGNTTVGTLAAGNTTVTGDTTISGTLTVGTTNIVQAIGDGDATTLASANTYTDQRFNNIETKYQAAVASSIAIASLPQPTNAGHSMVSFSVGQWEKEQGYAVGVSGVTENNKWVYKAAGTGNSRGDFGGGISFGFQWK